MNGDEIQMVSDSEGGPPMPWAAWCALQKETVRRHVSDFLDEQGVPQDHALRAKAMRQRAGGSNLRP